MTINQARGCHPKINDMMHHTLESIKKYYDKESGDYPLKNNIERYGYFFDSFRHAEEDNGFDNYIEYNLLQDHELLPKKFPTNESELIEFWTKSIDFLEARSKRIEEYARRNNLSDLKE